jgi:hypothetical protein
MRNPSVHLIIPIPPTTPFSYLQLSLITQYCTRSRRHIIHLRHCGLLSNDPVALSLTTSAWPIWSLLQRLLLCNPTIFVLIMWPPLQPINCRHRRLLYIATAGKLSFSVRNLVNRLLFVNTDAPTVPADLRPLVTFRVSELGKWTAGDLQENKIQKLRMNETEPEFIRTFKERLYRRRNVGAIEPEKVGALGLYVSRSNSKSPS